MARRGRRCRRRARRRRRRARSAPPGRRGTGGRTGAAWEPMPTEWTRTAGHAATVVDGGTDSPSSSVRVGECWHRPGRIQRDLIARVVARAPRSSGRNACDEASAQRAAEIASLTGLRGLPAFDGRVIHTSGVPIRLDRPADLRAGEPLRDFRLSPLYRPGPGGASASVIAQPSARSSFRRATRIFPAYWLVLFIVAVIIQEVSACPRHSRLVAGHHTDVDLRGGACRAAMLHTWSLASGSCRGMWLSVPGGSGWSRGSTALESPRTVAVWHV